MTLAEVPTDARGDAVDLHAHVPIVSCDGHIGPRLTDMRPYCPAAYLERYDAYADEIGAMASRLSPYLPAELDGPEARLAAEHAARMRATEGAHDMHARLRDMDSDGIAAELVFHGVQDLRPVPWVGLVGFNGGELVDPTNVDLRVLGGHIYNQWLADACSIQPERHIAAALLPLWDIDASITEMRWARAAGLRAVNFPAPRRGLRFYDDPVWEPFWSACEDLGMILVTHAGAIDREDTFTTGPHAVFLGELEAGGWPGRRGLYRMIFGGVFERHPELRLLLVEQMSDWWTATIKQMDSAYQSHSWMVRTQMPRPPSEYLREHVYIGASFMAPFEAAQAVDEGFVGNVIWGRDYPHVEGTWQPRHGDDEIMTHLSIRYALSGVEPRHARAILSDNAVRALGLDATVLQQVADRIGALTLTQVGVPIGAIPEPGRGGSMAFRTMGPWG